MRVPTHVRIYYNDKSETTYLFPVFMEHMQEMVRNKMNTFKVDLEEIKKDLEKLKNENI